MALRRRHHESTNHHSKRSLNVRKSTGISLIALAIAASHADAQPVTWQVVAGEDGRVVTAGLPTGTNRGIGNAMIGNVGAQQHYLRLSTPSALVGYWSWQGNEFVRFAATATSGAEGPGRTGAESDHVFKSLPTRANGGAGPDGQRMFFAQAGQPGSTANDLWGMWRWNQTRNVEVARPLTDGPLGPGLGTGWIYPNVSNFAWGLAMSGSATLMHAEVRNINNASRRMVTRHNGQVSQPCLLSGSTETHLAPGLTPGDSFATFSEGLDRFSLNRYGVVHGRLSASGSRSGYWTLCNGAPRVIAANNETGRLGPNIGVEGAVFSSFSSASPHASGSEAVMFWADWRVAPASSRLGLFRADGQGNQPVALNDTDGYYGPNWQGSVWRTFYTDTLSVDGEYAVFRAEVTTTDNTAVTGLWRVRAGDRPQLLALAGIPGEPYEPEAGRVWRSFAATAVFANGDVVVQADSNPGSITDWWLLRPGAVPRRILSVGDTLVIPTSTGNVSTTVSSLTTYSGGSRHASGEDDWAGEDGSLFLRVNVPTYGQVRISTGLGGARADQLFASGLQ